MRAAAKMGLVSAAFALLVATGCGDDPAGPPAPPEVDVTGSWDVEVEFMTVWYAWGTATLTMAVDGTVTGTLGSDTVTGRVSGYTINLTLDDGFGYKVYLSGTVDPSGTSAAGTWHDTDGDGGDWVVTKL